MTPLTRSRSQRVAAIVAGSVLAAVGLLPLFGGPGYESALAAGIVLPSAAAIATARDVLRADGDGNDGPSALAVVGRGIASGLTLAALAYGVSLLHGLRVGFCDLWGGTRGYVLTAALGAVMGGAWGGVAGEIARRLPRPRLVATLLALAAPLGGIVISVARFYATPMVFAFDPFFGYFSGTLYDTVIDAGTALLTYRLGSLATLGALAFSASVLTRAPGALRLLPLRGAGASATRARLALAATFALVSAIVCGEGSALGHWQTSRTIAAALGGQRSGARCDVVYPDGEREDQVQLLVRDCEEELAHDEHVFGTTFPGRITAFFFHDAAEKKRFMGAGDTYIAKPWRREVYLQLHSYPHPVLGHEIAHVVAGSFARGPFRIAGAAGGWWPNPGLIEGVAVAASPDEEELTNAQWARTMLDLGILPPMQRVFSFGFLGDASAKSYTLAGAFVRWAMAKWGSETIRHWYAGEDLPSLTRMPWDALDEAFRAHLRELSFPPEAQAYAKARFDRPSVFGRTCPHVVDGLRGEADHCRDTLQVDHARTLYDDVLARDTHDWSARFSLGVMELHFGDPAVGAVRLRELADDEVTPRPYRDRAAEVLADTLLASDDARQWPKARAAYADLAAHVLDEDAGRTIEVKEYAAARTESDPTARRAIVALLVGARGRPLDGEEGLARVASWAALAHDPVAEYVLGKNLVNREFWSEAAEHFDLALTAGVPTARIGRELLRQRAIVACALGDVGRAADVRTRVLVPDGPFGKSGGRKAWLLALLDRCSP